MYKFRRVLAAKIYLKCIIFVKNPPNCQALGDTLPDPYLFNNHKMYKTPIPFNISS